MVDGMGDRKETSAKGGEHEKREAARNVRKLVFTSSFGLCKDWRVLEPGKLKRKKNKKGVNSGPKKGKIKWRVCDNELSVARKGQN